MNHHQFHVGGWCQTVLSDRLKVRDSVCAANQGMLSGSPHHPPQAEEKNVKKKLKIRWTERKEAEQIFCNSEQIICPCTSFTSDTVTQMYTPALTSGFRGCRQIVEATLIADFTGLILTVEWAGILSLLARGSGI